MKRKHVRKWGRTWSRLISMLLVIVLLGNDCFSSGYTVFAAETNEEVLNTEEQTEQGTEAATEPAPEDSGPETEEDSETVPESTESESTNESTDNSEILDDSETGAETEETTEDPPSESNSEDPASEEVPEIAADAVSGIGTVSDFLSEDEPQTVLISEEDVSKRSSNIKYFQNEDHSYTVAVYPDPVHYLEDGQWKEINNQLIDAGTEEGTSFLGNTQNLFDVKFAKKSNGSKLVKIKMDDFQISWQLEGAQKVDANQKEYTETEAAALDAITPQKHMEEEPDNLILEEPATLLTENPDAAEISLAAAEEELGNRLNNDPKYNNTDGILPEEQESYQDTDEENEETLDEAYYDRIEEANQEKMKVDNQSSGVVYADILPGIDLEYIIESQRLKENLIIKEAGTQTSFTFQFKVNGMNPVQEGNTILFQDGEGTTIFELQPPFMYDADGEYSDKVSLELVKGNGKKCEITMTVDEEWLNEEGRAFPVVVDPAIESNQSATAIEDTYVLSGYPTTNYYLREVLKTGVDSTAGIGRSFLKFTLPTLKSGDMVVDARLNLYCYSSGSSEVTVTAHQVYSEWTSSTMTWENQPGAGTVADYQTFTPTTGNPVTFSITDIVKYWYNYGYNNGVMIKAAKESGQYVEYVSSDYNIESIDARPSVIITYINCSGLEDYWTYHSQSVGRAGTGYVNDYNGNLVFLHDTVSTSGNRMPLSLAHVYNTNDKDTNLGYGYGWRLNYLQTIKSTTISGTQYYEYVDEDGTLHYFYYDSDDSRWKDESGIDLELTIGSSTSEKYIVNDKSDNQLIFDSSGKLVKIKDQNGNAISITYSGTKITKITDGVGRAVTLTYGSDGNLSKVTDPSNRSKTFTYSGGLLTTITDTDNETVSYTYSGTAMGSATNIDGYRVDYYYSTGESSDLPHRVSEIAESVNGTVGQGVMVQRESNFAMFLDYKNRRETYLFNNAGNTISIADDHGRGQMAKYLTEGTNKNKISKVSDLTQPVMNLLKNPYFSSSSNWTLVQENGTAALTAGSANARVGSNSFRMTSTQTAGKAGVKQSVTLEAGEDYTLSVYVKTDEVNLQQDKGVVQIHALTSAGTNLYSQEIDYYETEDGWFRLMTTLTIPSGTTVSSADVYIGIEGVADAYFDCVQLEEAVSANHFNLIENGDFRYGTSGYTLTNTSPMDRVKDLSMHAFGEDTDMSYRRGVITATSLNMRSGPGSSYSTVTTLKQGNYITALGEGTDANGVTWYYTYYVSSGRVYSGYMSSAYISFSEGQTAGSYMGVVDASSLNVREGAGTSYGVLTSLSRNAEVQILERITASNGQVWALVTFTKNSTRYTGFVLADYVYNYYVDTMIAEIISDTMESNGFFMYGNPAMVKKVTQTLDISGSAGDVYMGSLWTAGYSLPLTDSRTHGMEVEFVASDGTKETYTSNFEATTYLWQYLSEVFIPKKDYVKINVSCIYSYNGNCVAFDGLSFYKEDFAQSYTYDEEGNVTSVKDLAEKKSTFEYDGNNDLKKMLDPKGNDYEYTYDSSHNVTSAVSAANLKYTFQYDTYGNPTETKVVDPSDESSYIRSTAGYSSDGNYQTSVTDALGNTVESTYDTTKGLLTSASDGKDNVTEYTYDSMDRLTKVSMATEDGYTDGTVEVSYAYEDDSLKSITHNGYQYTFEEDGFGNSTSVYVAGTQLVSRTYEEGNGNLLTEQYANGYTYRYTYDDFDRVTDISMTDPSGTKYDMYRYEYNSEGSLAAEYDIREDIGKGTIVTRYFYDLSGRLVYTRTGSGESYRYTYDLNDNLVKSTQTNEYRTVVTEYTYDADNRETRTKTASKTYSTVYDALGRITSRSWDTTTPYTTQYTYQAGANGSQSAQVQKVTSGGVETSYTYDANGNITSITSGSTSISYSYDEKNQLIREDNSQLDQTIAYVYDLGGNITAKKIYSYQPATTNDALAQATPTDTITYGYDTVWKDKLVSYDGQTITYDALGNPISYRGMTLGWQKARELGNITKDGQIYTYRYNENGLRNFKYMPDGTVSYQYDGDLLVGENKKDSSGNLVYELEFIYDSGGNILALIYNGMEYYYEKNLQGDITGIRNNQGIQVVTYQYDSWGRQIGDTGDQTLKTINPFRYRGYYYDEETGLYYLNSRYYDAEIGRFLNSDSIVASVNGAINGYNLYAYCFNNPVNLEDPDGNYPQNGMRMRSASWYIMNRAIKRAVDVVPKIIEDISNFDTNNTSETTVLESNYFSAYKGKLTIRTNGNRSGSFGVLFITRETNNRDHPEDIVRHEYGHTKQLEQLGVLVYTLGIGIPSLLNLGTGPYYDKPWEVTADIYGGVQSRNPSEESINNGFLHLELLKSTRPVMGFRLFGVE